MTTARQNRCVHCKSVYIFHPSFYGGEEINYPHNHHNYCAECYKCVQESLLKIPVKYEKRFIPSDKYTKEEIVAHQEARCLTGLPTRRILATMFDMSGQSYHKIVCEFMPDDEWYAAEWWTDKLDDVKITKEVWCSV